MEETVGSSKAPNIKPPLVCSGVVIYYLCGKTCYCCVINLCFQPFFPSRLSLWWEYYCGLLFSHGRSLTDRALNHTKIFTPPPQHHPRLYPSVFSWFNWQLQSLVIQIKPCSKHLCARPAVCEVFIYLWPRCEWNWNEMLWHSLSFQVKMGPLKHKEQKMAKSTAR